MLTAVERASLFDGTTPGPEVVLKQERKTIIWRQVDDHGRTVVIKLYRLRGAVTALRGYLAECRVAREDRRLRHLLRWGVPCSTPLGWWRGWIPQHGFYEVLAMLEVPDSTPLDEWLAGHQSEDLLRRVFECVRAMHESGLCHQALAGRNILVAPGPDETLGGVIIDLPKAWIFPYSIVGSRMARFDLQDLVFNLISIGVPENSVPLDAYGLDDGQRALLWSSLRHHPHGKLKRRARDAEIRGRHLLASAAFWRPRAAPPVIE